ncbi:MAG: tRNA (adenosine(37)-N6)-threonylcarbamoyltransferase complex transferase subunit TsaD, partial [Candidatus Moraniibacteriota bacterium]
MKILSIETSCDETAAAIIDWSDNEATVLANTVSSQASLHAKWGGVVPDLASREHTKNIVPVVKETLERAGLSPADIDLIAVTEGPGLMPALVIGVTAAKTLSFIWDKPLIGIQHLEGHIYANFIGNNQNQSSTFPLVALVVSGGHTELVLMQDHFQYEILGETQDDAAGEAFDKVAKMLGLDYPGGPIVAKRADAFRESTSYQLQATSSHFPRPMLDADNFDFSFSGLKTSVLYFLKKHEEQKKDETFINEVCHEFQEAVVDVLVAKTKKALELYSPATFVIAGGVSANVRLR